MKTILLTTISVVVILMINWSAKTPNFQKEAELQIQESKELHDSAMIYLKELHDKNDSLLDLYFKKY